MEEQLQELREEEQPTNYQFTTLEIELVDVASNKEITDANDIRYICVKEASGYENNYALALQGGKATLVLEQVAYGEIRILQLDEYQQPLSCGSVWDISFYANDVFLGKDELCMTINQEYTKLQICNSPCNRMQLCIQQQGIYKDIQLELESFEYGTYCIDLNQENGYSQVLYDLYPGEYCLRNLSSMEENLYLVNQQPQKEGEIFMLENESNTLTIESKNYPPATLIIDQYIRLKNNELAKPHYDEKFKVCVSSQTYQETFVLQASNDFCLRLCDLKEDVYTIEVLDIYADIHFVVDQEETKNNTFMVYANQSTQVRMIVSAHTTQTQSAPLRICKYVRRSNQQLVKPDPNTSFKVMLTGCGIQETFNLNAANNFCVDMEHICCGEYEVRELDHEGYVASYQINDELETTRACFYIHEGYNTCVNVINEERNRGQVAICKMIKDCDGSLIKPDRNSRFLVTLRSFFSCETFVLDASNDFCVHISNLKEGSYEVKERCVEGFDTTYSIDGGKEERKARFVVMNQCCVDVKIIDTPQRITHGDLRISKYIANAYGEYAKPSMDEEFQVRVSGSYFNEVYTLRSANQWCIILEGLPQGTYQIEEVPIAGYTCSYFVNQQPQEKAMVTMDGCNQEVDVINTRCNYGDIKINVFIEECDGNRHRPNPQEFFEVLVETACDCQIYRLDASNHFCIYLEDMSKGRVRITQKDSYGYRVMYEVNSQLMKQATLLMEGEDMEVNIINQMMRCSGMVHVNAYLEDAYGNLMTPNNNQEFAFALESRCIAHEYILNQYNQYAVFFDDLEEGTYEIIAQENKYELVGYRVNNTMCDCGRFVLKTQDIYMDLIYKEKQQPKVVVEKLIMEQENLVKPQPCESFRFLIKGRNLHEMYELNAKNDWKVELTHLQNQHYEIQELDVNCNITYDVNGEWKQQAYFLFDQEDVHVTIINEESNKAMVQFQVVLKDGCNQTLVPSKMEQFEVMIESNKYKECMVFDFQNHFQICKDQLPEGYYHIKNVGSYQLKEIYINQEQQQTFAFDLVNQDLEITLIFEEGYSNGLKIERKDLYSSKNSYEIMVEHKQDQEIFSLNASNDYSIELDDIRFGNYTISSMNPEIAFEYQGNYYPNCVVVDVENEVETIYVVDVQQPQAKIEISYVKQDEKEQIYQPDEKESYEVKLYGPTSSKYLLNAANQWHICIQDAVEGVYQVVVDKEDVYYQINQQAVSKQGYFTLQQKPIQVTILEKEMRSKNTSISFHALIKDCDGTYESAPKDEKFFIEVDGCQVQEDIILSQRNGFLMELTHLPQGEYKIRQIKNANYESVAYRINGNVVDQASVYLGLEPIQIDCINAKACQKGSIHVQKYIQDETCGCLKQPNKDDEFEIQLMYGAQIESVILSIANQWQYHFQDLKEGRYQILEVNADKNTSYIVNKEQPNFQAILDVNGNTNEVKVINPNHNIHYGKLEIMKKLKNAQGQYIDPNQDQSFWICIESKDEIQRVLLHAANHFYVQLQNLADGKYRIYEEGANSATYIVNDGKEQMDANILIQNNIQSVQVINPIPNDNAIVFTKYIKKENQEIVKATTGTYTIQIQQPNFMKEIQLNQSNEYQVIVDDLNTGFYILNEVGVHDVVYEVDGKLQSQGMIVVGENTNVNIINMENQKNNGTIVLEKFIKDASGLLLKPNKTDIFYVHVSYKEYNEVVSLTKENQWKYELKNLQPGDYNVVEIGHENQVSYIIDQGIELTKAVVNVDYSQHYVQILNAQKATDTGSITITKWMRYEQELEIPKPNFEAEVHVSKPGFNQRYLLNEENNWTITLSNLEKGVYNLQEIGCEDDVVWQIDGSYEVAFANVMVDQDAHEVKMINEKASTESTLHISKRILQNNAYVMPSVDEEFIVNIIGTTNQQIRLNDKNNWHEKLVGLANGTYQVEEIQQTGYQTQYQVNNEPLSTEAMVVLNDNVQNVRIINQKETLNQLQLQKFIKMSSGGLIPPADGDEYTVEITSANYKKQFQLNEENNFRIVLNDLEAGKYSVKEITNDPEFEVSYRLNSGEEVDELSFSITANEIYRVEVINERKEDMNTLDVYKYMRDAQGNYEKPNEKQVFRFLLTGNNFNQYYTLNKENNWHMHFNTLSSGEYEIIEQGSGSYDVQYLVNGSDFQDSAFIIAAAGKENIVEIVNLEATKKDGKITVEKKIRTVQGDIIIPSNQQEFRVQLSNEKQNYSTTISLNEQDGYLQTIENLPYGDYTLKEDLHSDYNTTYIVNEQEETQGASFSIVDDTTQNIEIINSEKRKNTNVAKTTNASSISKNRSNIQIVLE